MSTTLIDIFLTVSQIVGILIVALVGFCVLIFLVATYRFAIVSHELAVKAATARHISADELPVNDNASFFSRINEEAREDDWRARVDPSYLPREEYLAQDHIEFREVSEEQRRIAAQNRFKLGYATPAPVVPNVEETAVYEPITLDSTPPDGVIFVNGQAVINDAPPFNLKDPNSEPASSAPH